MAPTLSSPPFAPRTRNPLVAQFLAAYPSTLFSETLYQSVELMERYSIEQAIDLLDRLQVLPQLEDWRSPEELCRTLGFVEHFRTPLRWLCRRFLETDCIEEKGDTFRLRQQPWAPELTRLRAEALALSPGNAPTLALLDRAAELYPAVARGEQSGEQALFGPQGIPLWLSYFHNDNLTYAVNNWVTAVLAAEQVASRSPLRILEVGAGAGSAAETLLRWFEERGFLPRLERYLMTEPNAFFRRRGQRELSARFRDLPLEWSALDINRPWEEQGIAAGSFDLVFGVNVLHVAGDLLFSLNEARRALAPGGSLVVGECVRPFSRQPLYPELIFQLLESFTAVKTDPSFRPNPGFLTPEQWRAAFARAEFKDVTVQPDIESIREMHPHFFTAALAGKRGTSL